MLREGGRRVRAAGDGMATPVALQPRISGAFPSRQRPKLGTAVGCKPHRPNPGSRRIAIDFSKTIRKREFRNETEHPRHAEARLLKTRLRNVAQRIAIAIRVLII